jgi:5-methylcytosine-specific restriction enzyme A
MPGKITYYRRPVSPVPIRQPARQTDAGAEQWADFINSRLWRKCSKSYLARNPLCIECRKANRLTAATQTHHTRGHDPEFRLDESTFAALCQACHSAITRTDMNVKVGKKVGG